MSTKLTHYLLIPDSKDTKNKILAEDGNFNGSEALHFDDIDACGGEGERLRQEGCMTLEGDEATHCVIDFYGTSRRTCDNKITSFGINTDGDIGYRG